MFYRDAVLRYVKFILIGIVGIVMQVSMPITHVHQPRISVRLGNMLATTPMDESSLSLLLSHVHDFLR